MTTYTATESGQPSEAFRAWLLDHDVDPMATTEVEIDGDTLRATQLDLGEDGKVQLDGDQFVLLKTVEVAIKRPAPPYGAIDELIDPDCRAGKHAPTCVGDPCGCACHEAGSEAL